MDTTKFRKSLFLIWLGIVAFEKIYFLKTYSIFSNDLNLFAYPLMFFVDAAAHSLILTLIHVLFLLNQMEYEQLLGESLILFIRSFKIMSIVIIISTIANYIYLRPYSFYWFSTRILGMLCTVYIITNELTDRGERFVRNRWRKETR